VKRITVEQRRARMARRHHLAVSSRSRDVVEVAGDLVALHATDPTTVYLSALARLRTQELGAVERALYDDRSLVRMLAMRRTMWVAPADLVPVLHAACARALEQNQRRVLIKLVEDAGITDDGAAWARKLERATLRELRARGTATAAELSKAVPGLDARIPYGEGKAWAGEQGVGPRVLILLGTAGAVIRGRPGGTWVSSQYAWVPTEEWIPGGIPAMPVEDARVELVRRWLWSFGPGTLADLKWWTGLGVGEVKRALTALDPVEVELDGGPGLLLPDDTRAVRSAAPWVALLPALDPTVMGWKERDWYLGPHQRTLFDTNGNAGPTVWSDGQVVGGWAQRKDGEVVVRLLEDVGAEARAAIDVTADGLEKWLGGHRVLPRFPSPLHRELSS
jgi:hypothetical protein